MSSEASVKRGLETFDRFPYKREMPKRKGTSKFKGRLNVAMTADAGPATVPTRWVKAVVGLFLLPPAWVLTQTFFGAFAWATVERGFWMSEAFWFFALGGVIWSGVFFGLPRPMWIYVFGHELTHAIWVLLMGGRVRKFHVSRDGGHILTDKVNTWIALAPYFFPIYSLIVIGVYFLLGLFVDVVPYDQWLYGSLGFTWAFHLTFTCSMIFKGQSDLEYGGHFFSLMVIYLANLLLLSVMLIIGSPQISLRLFGRELLHNAMDLTEMLTRLLHQIPI